MNYIKKEPEAFGAALLTLHNIYADAMKDVCPGDAVAYKQPHKATYIENLSGYIRQMEDQFFSYLKHKYANKNEVVGCFVNVDTFVDELHKLGFTKEAGDDVYAGYLAYTFYRELYPCDLNFDIKDIVAIVKEEV